MYHNSENSCIDNYSEILYRCGLCQDVMVTCSKLLKVNSNKLVACSMKRIDAIINVKNIGVNNKQLYIQTGNTTVNANIIKDICGKHSPGSVILYKCLDININFVIANVVDFKGYYISYLICEYGNLCRIILSMNRVKKSKIELPKLVLPDNMLNDIITNTIGFLKNLKTLKEYNASLKRGVILSGPPGNGKTSVCRYLVAYCNIHNIKHSILNASDLKNAYNDGELDCVLSSDSVVFLDDINIGYFNRSSTGNADFACSLLAAMDSIAKNGSVVRIFTTNEDVDQLDDAFKRPGRIDKIYKLDLPDENLRRQFILTWHNDILNGINIEDIVKKTYNYSYATLDEIKTQLVLNYILYGKWLLDDALKCVDNNKTHVYKPMGFSMQDRFRRYCELESE